MWNIKSKVFYLLLFLLSIEFCYGQNDLKFFHAKSEISIEKNGQREDFIAHIRYNLVDTLWISFTGALGIEGARMLVTKDSTYVINKIEKSYLAFANEEANDIIPYAFSLNDWKLLLLNYPLVKDSGVELIMENEVLVSSRFSDGKIQRTYEKNNRILKCELNNTRSGMLCEILYNKYDSTKKVWDLAIERQIQIYQPTSEPIKVKLRYLDFTFNQMKPFHFNNSYFKNETSP